MCGEVPTSTDNRAEAGQWQAAPIARSACVQGGGASGGSSNARHGWPVNKGHKGQRGDTVERARRRLARSRPLSASAGQVSHAHEQPSATSRKQRQARGSKTGRAPKSVLTPAPWRATAPPTASVGAGQMIRGTAVRSTALPCPQVTGGPLRSAPPVRVRVASTGTRD